MKFYYVFWELLPRQVSAQIRIKNEQLMVKG